MWRVHNAPFSDAVSGIEVEAVMIDDHHCRMSYPLPPTSNAMIVLCNCGQLHHEWIYLVSCVVILLILYTNVLIVFRSGSHLSTSFATDHHQYATRHPSYLIACRPPSAISVINWTMTKITTINDGQHPAPVEVEACVGRDARHHFSPKPTITTIIFDVDDTLYDVGTVSLYIGYWKWITL